MLRVDVAGLLCCFRAVELGQFRPEVAKVGEEVVRNSRWAQSGVICQPALYCRESLSLRYDRLIQGCSR